MVRAGWKCIVLMAAAIGTGCVNEVSEADGAPLDGPQTTTRTSSALVDPSVCPAGANVIVGSPGPDTLIGTTGRDCILGDGGNDRLEGGNGDDVLIGGDGDDTLVGGNGVDTLDGGDGDDQLLGGNGADSLAGGAGNDLLVGDSGDDQLAGGAGHDVLSGGNGADGLAGDAGDDVIDSGRGDDAVSGGAGIDRCTGGGCESGEQPVATCSADADCSGGLRCSSAGLCVACLSDLECDDGNTCTSQSCQPALGCRNPNVPDGTLCLDATVCNGSEICTAGTCTAGTPLVCEVGYRCEAVPGCINVDECAENADNCDTNASCSDTPGSFTCTCNAPDFEGDGVTCRRWCDPVVVGAGVERCVRAREDGSVSLHLTRDDRTAWEEEWVQADEPEENFCGPTAGKNLLFWYGMDAPYGTLAAEMKTNTWDTGLVFGAAFLACGGELICAGIVTAVVSDAAVKAGTLPADMRTSLFGRRPAGYVACAESGDANLDEIRFSLANGNPVVYLESRGEGNLHWALVTGIFLDGGQPQLRIANSVNRSWDDFKADWSVQKVSGDIGRGLLDGLLGIRANVRVRWERSENATDLGGGTFACP